MVKKKEKTTFRINDLMTKPSEVGCTPSGGEGGMMGTLLARVYSDGVASGKAFIRGAYTDRRTAADLVSLPPSPRACSIGEER